MLEPVVRNDKLEAFGSMWKIGFKHLVLPTAMMDRFQRTEPPVLQVSTQQNKTLFKDGMAGVWASEAWFTDVAPRILSSLRLNSVRYRCPASLISSVPQEQRITWSSPPHPPSPQPLTKLKITYTLKKCDTNLTGLVTPTLFSNTAKS